MIKSPIQGIIDGSDTWIIKWKGHRGKEGAPYQAQYFPQPGLVNKVAPLTFGSHITRATGKKVSSIIPIDKDGIFLAREEGDPLVWDVYWKIKESFARPTLEELQSYADERKYPELYHEGYYSKGAIVRKKGKEKIEVFHRDNPKKAFDAYALLRKEEQMFSRLFYPPMKSLVEAINLVMPGNIVTASTCGSHSYNWGNRSGNLMSWIDADVDIDIIVNEEKNEVLSEKVRRLSRLLDGDTPVESGSPYTHTVFSVHRKIPGIDLPITGNFPSKSQQYNLWFTTYDQFIELKMDLNQAFPQAFAFNSSLLYERKEGEYQQLRDHLLRNISWLSEFA